MIDVFVHYPLARSCIYIPYSIFKRWGTPQAGPAALLMRVLLAELKICLSARVHTHTCLRSDGHKTQDSYSSSELTSKHPGGQHTVVGMLPDPKLKR